MTSTLLQPPKTPEWDKAMHAQNEAELLRKFLTWLQYDISALPKAWSIERLIANYYNINLDKLAEEQEQWEKFENFLKKELDID